MGAGHAHHQHAHAARADADGRRLAIALALILALLAGEVVAGIVGRSLALLSDAGHMLTDAVALGLSLVAARLAARPARGVMTYGLGRAEILSAQANGVTLVLLAVVIVAEGIRRLFSPPDVHGGLVLAVGLVGAAVNLIATRVLSGANRESLNVEGAYRHLLTDLFAFLATAVAGAVVLASGFDRADALASLLVAASMLVAGTGLVKRSGRIFLEAAPEGVDPEAIGRALAAQPGVVQVHDLHVWEVTSGFPALSCHGVVGADRDCHDARQRLEVVLRERFKLDHTTLQVEHEQLFTIESSAP
ncbi:MAG: cobalt-zinc-cadmium efflux system protein [Solirubrobacteraceae bacterium]|nr:cobalt-zinc-cadmium efflux system protein [Solirubrobacteraceae bacterium]